MQIAKSRSITLRTLGKVRRADGTVTLQRILRKSFHPCAPLVPLQATLAFFHVSVKFQLRETNVSAIVIEFTFAETHENVVEIMSFSMF